MKTNASRALKRRLDAESGLGSRIAEQLGISHVAVSAWGRGVSRPKAHHREALQALLEIPAADWATAKERETVARAAGRAA
jgi:transcriptional regulator with XRE-family HTH domain